MHNSYLSQHAGFSFFFFSFFIGYTTLSEIKKWRWYGTIKGISSVPSLLNVYFKFDLF